MFSSPPKKGFRADKPEGSTFQAEHPDRDSEIHLHTAQTNQATQVLAILHRKPPSCWPLRSISPTPKIKPPPTGNHTHPSNNAPRPPLDTQIVLCDTYAGEDYSYN